MPYHPPDPFNIADYFLDDRVREGLGDRPALRTAGGIVTYAALQARANRFANAIEGMGVQPEQRVLIALPDGARLRGCPLRGPQARCGGG